jgi:hypothetical protein
MGLHYRSWRLPIKYFLNLAGVNYDALNEDDMSKKQTFIQPESTNTPPSDQRFRSYDH